MTAIDFDFLVIEASYCSFKLQTLIFTCQTGGVSGWCWTKMFNNLRVWIEENIGCIWDNVTEILPQSINIYSNKSMLRTERLTFLTSVLLAPACNGAWLLHQRLQWQGGKDYGVRVWAMILIRRADRMPESISVSWSMKLKCYLSKSTHENNSYHQLFKSECKGLMWDLFIMKINNHFIWLTVNNILVNSCFF